MPVSRLGVIGDVHASDERLSCLLSFLLNQGVDAIACVGDVVDGVGCVDTCCKLLAEAGVITVAGNHDEWCVRSENRRVKNATEFSALDASSREFLESLPTSFLFESLAGKCMLCHGLGEYNLARVDVEDTLENIFRNLELRALHRDESLKFVFNGHTHEGELRRFGHLTVV